MHSVQWTLGPDDLAEQQMRGYQVGGRWVLVAKIGGHLKAIDDWCNHAGCLLSQGTLRGNAVVCPCHEVAFDLDTGENVERIHFAGDQLAYRAEAVDGQIVVTQLGDG